MTTRRAMLRLGLAMAALPALQACSPSSSDATGGTQGAELDVAAFKARAARDGMQLLDVRTPQEFADGHLAGAVNLDFQGSDFGPRIASLDKSAPYAIYCRSGRRSAAARDAMVEAGFTDVAHLQGGITAWQQAGEAVTKD